ncbi:hypothetical protein [Kaistia terrae]|uniref:Serine kinase n=1 Tax=Kaistia terrae TaxID=537017 RepID=A0ABW0PU41_9HYPH|nr:hypothetical protein [Kaistia terrae]MCX5577102.1 hypothetical protein [Kaistia terrae]
MSTTRFVIPGLTFNLVDQRQDTGEVAFPQLAEFVQPEGPVEHEIVIREAAGDDIAPQGAMIWSGTLIDGSYAEIHRSGERQQFYMPGRLSIIEEAGRPLTEVLAVGSAEKPLRSMAGAVLFDIALRGHGLMTIHSASLLLPDRDELVLLFAPSGFGKTTTSLALALGGFGHMGDDAVILRQDGTDLVGWGMPRTLKVQRRTAALFPEIAPHLGEFGGDEDEAPLTRAALAGLMPLPDATRSYKIAAVVVVGPRSDGEASLSRLSKADALSVILTDNIGVFDDGVPPQQQVLFRLLSKLVSATPTYRLNAGTLPRTIAPAFDAALGIVREAEVAAS